MAAADGEAFAAVAERLIISLAAIETRHRRTLAPVVAAFLADATTQAAKDKLQDAIQKASLGDAERGVLETGVRLRATSRVVAEGVRGLAPRALSMEFEQRE